MIWLGIFLVAALALAPFGWTVWRGGHLRNRRDAAMALHRGQLLELDRDLAEGRLLDSEHAAAKLEVQRRLLADADLAEAESKNAGPLVVGLTAILVPAIALFLYVEDGMPNYRQVAAAASQPTPEDLARDQELVTRLRAVLATMDPTSPRTRKGYIMLGNAELTLRHLPEAANAWQQALATEFDPTLAAQTAELLTDSQGHVTPEAAALFKRALAAAPADAPWRKAVEKRLAEAGGS